MTSGKEKCGLSSLLPMSCRERAEAFARRLHSRLTSLDSEEVSAANENSWLAGHPNSLTLSQPRHISGNNSETGFYVTLGSLESPDSPDKESDGAEFETYINEDNFGNLDTDNLLRNEITEQLDSDSSDGPFYDTQGDVCQKSETEVNSYLCISNKPVQNDVNDDENIFENSDLNSKDFEVNIDNSSGSEYDLPTAIEEELYKEETSCSSRSEENSAVSLTVKPELPVNCSNEIEVVVIPCQLESKIIIPNDINGEENETDDKIPRVRRCSSLKTGKTPPGTPGEKKIVRFADVLGLDLADVRTFLDEIPKVPNSAYNDLRDVETKTSVLETACLNASLKSQFKIEKILVPLFQQPGGQVDFIDRIRDNQVCLDNAVVEDPVTLSIKGIVRVKNLDFHKSVHVRYTLDSWQSFADIQATYMEESCDGFSDKFSFLLFANNLSVGQKLEFAIRFQCKGSQYWDNNKENNYSYQCLPATTCSALTVPDDGWSTNFY